MYILDGNNYFEKDQYIQKLIDDNNQKFGQLSVIKYNLNEIENLEEVKLKVLNNNLFSSNVIYILLIDFLTETLIKFVEELNQLSETDNILLKVDLSKSKKLINLFNQTRNYRLFKSLSDIELSKWIKSLVNKNNGVIDQKSVTYLLNNISKDQYYLYHEINKLILLDKNISLENIQKICLPKSNFNVFNLIDEAFSGQINKSLFILNDLLRQNVLIPEILATIGWYLNVLQLLINNSNYSLGEISNKSGIKLGLLSKNQFVAYRYSKNGLSKIIDQIFQIDYLSKNTSINLKQAIEVLLIEINFLKN